ncbi:hypothetical protein DSO57_1014972 [Entomophthora muscae]|uniref:Uncharacterized protein n=1 Tax=Entomophthora muscae TaxID=34485 RepID=A0ACC2UF14_9FUNG|nr:hypothetical protein DSO57_1014972 [Entomophthora muscae]
MRTTPRRTVHLQAGLLGKISVTDTALMIIQQVKNLTQTGTVKKLTCAYEELRLWAPSDIAFDNPATHIMYYDTLKLHMMRHVNLDQVINLQSLLSGFSFLFLLLDFFLGLHYFTFEELG